MRNLPWQVQSTLLFAVVGPPIGSLIVLLTLIAQLTSWRLEIDPSGPALFVVAYFLFALPVGYLFGFVPALLAGATYSTALSNRLAQRARALLRGFVGALFGGLFGGLWFHFIVAPKSAAYAGVSAVVATLLAVCSAPAVRRALRLSLRRLFIDAQANLPRIRSAPIVARVGVFHLEQRQILLRQSLNVAGNADQLRDTTLQLPFSARPAL